MELVKKIFLMGLLSSLIFGFSMKAEVVSRENILAISWQKSFCKFHKDKKECKRLRAKDFAWSHFTLHGLWPQPRSKQNCSNHMKRVPKKLWEELKVKMPGVVSGLAKHEWRKHGSCYGKDEQEYFKDALKLLDVVNNSRLRDFFVAYSGKVISKEQLNNIIKKAFGYPRKVQMVCKNGVITELRFSLKGDVYHDSLKELLKDAKPLRGGCKRGKIE